MLPNFISWWCARISEVLPKSCSDLLNNTSSPVVVELDEADNISISLRRGKRYDMLNITDAVRLASQRSVLLRVPSSFVLETQHFMPTALRQDLDQALYYELDRITPFKAKELFWRWDSEPARADRTRVKVTVTLVPIAAVAHTLEMLRDLGITLTGVEVGPRKHGNLLKRGGKPERTNPRQTNRSIAGICVALVIALLILPGLLQARALHTVNSALESLQPVVDQVGVLRHQLAWAQSVQMMVDEETERSDTLVRVLAILTQRLPDDTYLTELSMHDRQILLRGRSAAAARLISALSVEPAIRDAAFIAPVTHAEGSAEDLFSMRCVFAP